MSVELWQLELTSTFLPPPLLAMDSDQLFHIRNLFNQGMLTSLAPPPARIKLIRPLLRFLSR